MSPDVRETWRTFGLVALVFMCLAGLVGAVIGVVLLAYNLFGLGGAITAGVAIFIGFIWVEVYCLVKAYS